MNCGRTRTLLLVDDEENIQKALTRVLRRDGYHILCANGGEQGLALLKSNPSTGVILSDQRMPEMTGIEFLSRACQLRPDTVRVVLSGYTDLKTVTNAINQGEIYKFLTKPWEDDLLRINVREAFEHFELRYENQRLAQELMKINTNLEQRVEQKTREALMNVHSLKITQEILENLPVGVLGFDGDSLLVVANQNARSLLSREGQGMVGRMAIDVLPDILLQKTNKALQGEKLVPFDISLGSKVLRIHCGRMEPACKVQGVIVVMTPKE